MNPWLIVLFAPVLLFLYGCYRVVLWGATAPHLAQIKIDERNAELSQE